LAFRFLVLLITFINCLKFQVAVPE